MFIVSVSFLLSARSTSISLRIVASSVVDAPPEDAGRLCITLHNHAPLPESALATAFLAAAILSINNEPDDDLLQPT